MRLYLVGALGCAILTQLLHQAIDQTRGARRDIAPLSQPQMQQVLPSSRALRLLSLGYFEVLADHYFLRALHHFGDPSMHAYLYPNLAPYLQRAVALDPLFAAAYILAGTSLTLPGMDGELAIELLRQGMARRPDLWRIAFLLGFNAYYLHNDHRLAAVALSQAARSDEAPSYLAPLAARLAVAAQTPQVGLDCIEAMLTHPQLAEPVRRSYQARRTLLLLEVALQRLQQACDIYRTRFGQPPAGLADLVRARLLREIPDDPLGGSFGLTPLGVVTTTHEAARLRLAPQQSDAP